MEQGNRQEQSLQCTTQSHSDSRTNQLIKEWLFRFGLNYEKDVAALLSLWLETFGGMDPKKLEIMFRRTLQTFKADYGRTFPRIADILEYAEKVKESATNEAAEIAWKKVLEIRRVHYNPDLPQYLAQALARLPERIQRAARAAGVFREHETTEALHVWAKKAFIESFRWETSEESLNLLPDCEIKTLIADAAQAKALPAAPQDWSQCRARGQKYRAQLTTQGVPDLSPEERLRVADELAEAARKVLEQPQIVTVSDETRKALRQQAELIKARYPSECCTDPRLTRYLLDEPSYSKQGS